MIPPLNFILIIIIIILLLLTTIDSIAPPGPQSRQHTNSSVPCVHTNSHVHANSTYPTLSHLDAIMGELQTTTQQSASTTTCSSNNDKKTRKNSSTTSSTKHQTEYIPNAGTNHLLPQ